MEIAQENSLSCTTYCRVQSKSLKSIVLKMVKIISQTLTADTSKIGIGEIEIAFRSEIFRCTKSRCKMQDGPIQIDRISSGGFRGGAPGARPPTD